MTYSTIMSPYHPCPLVSLSPCPSSLPLLPALLKSGICCSIAKVTRAAGYRADERWRTGELGELWEGEPVVISITINSIKARSLLASTARPVRSLRDWRGGPW